MLNNGAVLDGTYEVIRILGKGGMGTVYLCRNIRTEGLWAVKEIKSTSKEDFKYAPETDIMKGLNHPGIPRLIDVFYHSGNLFIVEDYIEGETLQNYIDKKVQMTKDEMYHVLIGVCDIVVYLHSFNPPIIYRDIKPSNIMITPERSVFLIDFGASRFYNATAVQDTILMGSRGYAAPEQYGTGSTDVRSDIYGIGALIYSMIKGSPPESLLEPLSEENYDSTVENGLKAIIKKCMQIDAKKRYASVKELKSDLEAYFHNDLPEKKGLKKKHAFALVGVTVLLSLLLIAFLSNSFLKEPSYSKVAAQKENPEATINSSGADVEKTEDIIEPTATPEPQVVIAEKPQVTPTPVQSKITYTKPKGHKKGKKK